MAKLADPNPGEVCVECDAKRLPMHAVKTIVLSTGARVPLCDTHLGELVAELAADSTE